MQSCEVALHSFDSAQIKLPVIETLALSGEKLLEPRISRFANRTARGATPLDFGSPRETLPAEVFPARTFGDRPSRCTVPGLAFSC